MSDTQKDPDWMKPGTEVIEWADLHGLGGLSVDLVRVHTVAGKSFTVREAGSSRVPSRYSKETLERRVGGTWGVNYRIEPLGTPLADVLLRQHALQKASRVVSTRWKEFDHDSTVDTAQTLKEALDRYIRAENALADAKFRKAELEAKQA